MASMSRVFLTSPLSELSLKPIQPPQLPRTSFAHHLLIRPFLPAALTSSRRRPSSSATISCLVSGVDGGGVSDDFVSTAKSGFGREFDVIANMLKQIQPLDTSVISKSVSSAAKDSMKQTISTMLGLLPSDQFSVTVRVSKHPLRRLIVSSIITGYTLWNVEYRTLLMKNFDISSNSSRNLNFEDGNKESLVNSEEVVNQKIQSRGDGFDEISQTTSSLQNLGNLSPEALEYIQQLETELLKVKQCCCSGVCVQSNSTDCVSPKQRKASHVTGLVQELNAQKQENLKIDDDERSNNNLLDYLRLLEPDMVSEISKPSSFEVEQVIHQLAENILQLFFKEEVEGECEASILLEVDTSRDYLAKLLFWCMLLGHHLRSLENRLHLSCVVGLL
ncbi:unnamed protein product [Cuscuta epithymum]|uniref:Seed maturation-like protein n=1 Tax=Cuscuta epithymum TaxID=186058 RepID=A0AAV0E727_9ASTE|nr:unnamed protein product [Cuscuta epithymum]